MSDDELAALRASAARLRHIVEPLSADQLRAPAYPTEWSIADVLSHLGAGVVIMRLGLDAALAGRKLPDDHAQPIWDEWNAKSPEENRADALAADRALLDRVGSLTDEQRERFTFSIGPIPVDLAGFLGLRLNEHAVHTWDIEVALEPNATVPPEAARLVVDNLGMITQFAGKPTGIQVDLHVRTTEPARDFTLSVGLEMVSLTPCPDAHPPDLELPAEALVRLVYGRLDAGHTPPIEGRADLDELRRVFSGI
jgi:uncharacterized protein (TIGR03083 family)